MFTSLNDKSTSVLSAKPPILLTYPPMTAKLSFLLKPQKSLIKKDAAPSYFAPEHYPELDYESNQEQCGDCWAVGSMNAISDRYSIMNKVPNPHFSPLDVITCTNGQTYNLSYKNYEGQAGDISPQACFGGYPEAACLFSEKTGLIPDNGRTSTWLDKAGCSGTCCSMEGEDAPRCYNDNLPQCSMSNPIKTVANSTRSLVVVNSSDRIDPSDTIKNMKREIYFNGPIIGKYAVYQDFVAYSQGEYQSNPWPSTNGIYIHSKDHSPYKGKGIVQCKNIGPMAPEKCKAGAHVVEIVGYGTDTVSTYGTIDYWIIRNSWGGDWGQKIGNVKYGGYGKIAMWAGGPSAGFAQMEINKDIGLDIPYATSADNTQISLYSPLFWSNPTFGGALICNTQCVSKSPSTCVPAPPPAPQKRPDLGFSIFNLSQGASIGVLVGIIVGIIFIIVLIVLIVI